ncbi:MAG: hypothetical protein R6W06_01115, partial [Prochlorococcaceae cyanobacterium]
FHDPLYLDALHRAGLGEHDLRALSMSLGTPDCPIFPGLLDYVSLAGGGSVVAAELVLAGEADLAFNPSGGYHHAHAGRASGFCYVNDVVLACDTLARAGKRVLFLDIDAHHCDGVQDAFYDRKDVMTVSLHESGKTLFPGTGFEEESRKGSEGIPCRSLVPSSVDINQATTAIEAASSSPGNTETGVNSRIWRRRRRGKRALRRETCCRVLLWTDAIEQGPTFDCSQTMALGADSFPPGASQPTDCPSRCPRSAPLQSLQQLQDP